MQCHARAPLRMDGAVRWDSVPSACSDLLDLRLLPMGRQQVINLQVSGSLVTTDFVLQGGAHSDVCVLWLGNLGMLAQHPTRLPQQNDDILSLDRD